MWTENVGVFLMTLIVEADFFKSAMNILNLTFSIKNWKSKVQFFKSAMNILNLTCSIKNWKSKVQFFKSAMNILNLTFSIQNWKSKVQNDHVWWSRNRPLLWGTSEIAPRLVIQSVHISCSFYQIFKDDFKKRKLYRIFFLDFSIKFWNILSVDFPEN
jgi:hypothetical protein